MKSSKEILLEYKVNNLRAFFIKTNDYPTWIVTNVMDVELQKSFKSSNTTSSIGFETNNNKTKEGISYYFLFLEVKVHKLYGK